MGGLIESRKRILKWFAGFLGGMLVLTLVSRGIYANGLPRVSVESPGRMAIEHVVEKAGNVKGSGELAVNVAEGLRVSEVFVVPGERIEVGTALFSLDGEYLMGRVREQERGIAKLELQVATLEGNLELAGEEKNLEMSRAGEDAVRGVEQAQKALGRALEDEAAARAQLQEHLNKNLKLTSEEERKRQEEAYQEWKARLSQGTQEVKSASGRVRELQRRAEGLQAEIDGLKKKIADAQGSSSGTEGGKAEGTGTEGSQEGGSGSVSGNGVAEGAQEGEAGQDGGLGDNGSGGSGGEGNEELEAWKAELAAKEAELSQVKKELAQAGYAQEDISEEVGALQGNAPGQPDFTSEDAQWESWMSTRKSLEDKITAAQRAVEDAEDALEKAKLEAERGLEDSMRPEQSDSSLGIYRLDLEAAREELVKLQELVKADGLISAKQAGIVTRVGVAAGENTPAGAAVVFADTEKPLQFEVILDKEEKKYVNQGSSARVSIGSGETEVTVDYLTEVESSPGSFRALMNLPEGVGTIGQSGSFRLSVQSELYNCCISIDALHTDENQRNFVYVLGERSGILGKELTAEKLMVEVLDKNNRYAALQSGALDGNSRIISAADRDFSEGDPVRMKE